MASLTDWVSTLLTQVFMGWALWLTWTEAQFGSLK